MMRGMRWAGSVACCLLAGVLWPGDAAAQKKTDKAPAEPAVDAGLVGALSMRSIGPALMSGRVVDIAVDPRNTSVWYVAAAAGGVWKTENAGVTFSAIFAGEGSWSIGTVVIDPNDSNVVWVGTGENNSQRAIGYGDGVYKSVDGGRSFKRMGLEHSEHIARIVVDPRDSDIVWVAAQGPLWAAGGDRGVYVTKDGGKTWTQSLAISENTGATDLILDPRDSDVLYAAAYQRRRAQWTLIDGGPESGVYRTIDGGATWEKMNSGLPGGEKGRIGLAMSPQNSDVLYAEVEAGEGGGTFKTENRAVTWSRTSSREAGTGQYYNELVADPNVADRIYSIESIAQVSEDGGRTWRTVGEEYKHIDNHVFWIDPGNSDHILSGNDGGVYESFDRGTHWRFFRNLPVSQFYKVATDNALPFYNVCGGTQDNASQCGPSQTRSVHGIRNEDWYVTTFGDGFQSQIDQTNPNIIYSESQYGGLVRYDKQLGEAVGIAPAESADGPPLRWNWDAAFILSPHDQKRIYFGSQFLHRSDDYGNSWRVISPDLTRDMDRNQLEVMGRIWSVDAVAKNASTSFYGTIVALAESPITEGLLYVGTDDGLVQVSEDGGASWRKVDGVPGVPARTYVNDLEASPLDANVVFGAFNDTKAGDFKPYLLKSTDRGRSWTSIAGDLPERGAVYTIVQDWVDANLLFCGTEFGAYTSLDGGQHWLKLGGLPTINVRDLTIQRRENDLVAATFGRGFWILDDITPLRTLGPDVVKEDGHIFPVKRALQYAQTNDIQPGPGGFQGADWYRTDNPPFGAVFTYYLKETKKTREQLRKAAESEAMKKGEGNPYPAWDSLRAEDREEAPKVWLVVRDASGSVVRRVEGANAQGIHRTTWDLRWPGYGPVSEGSDGFGPLAVPGTYTVELVRMVDGDITRLAGPERFQVEMLGTPVLAAGDRAETLRFQQQVGELQREVQGGDQVLQDAERRIGLIKTAIERMPQVDLSMRADARSLELRLVDLREVFNGDPTLPRRNEPGMPGLNSRLFGVVFNSFGATFPPTGTQREQYGIASGIWAELQPRLQQAAVTDLEALEARLEAAGVPYTPGRAIPGRRGG